MRMTATENINVYDRALSAGEEFEVPDTEGRVWILLGKAKQKFGGPVKAEPVFDGRYWRADMRAED